MSDPQTMEETQPQVNENNAGSGEGGHDVAKNNLNNDNPRESSPDNDPRSESEDFQSASPEPESEGDDANAKPKGRPRRDKRGYNNARQRKRQKLMEEAAASSDITKWSIRQKVWDHLEKNDLVNFPRPVTHRIPNFKGAAAAAEKAATLEVFKSAKTVKINPDKPQENCRFLTLEANKTLLVPTPRLRSGLFNKINPPDDCNKEMLRICATSQGVKEHSSPLGLDAEVKIDLVIVGSVAVSRQGYRIGKGEGFADLEFAMMATMGAVNADTIVVTTVHESQIMDIPEELLGEHDLTVDYIVTEDEIIECDSGRPKPTGIIWSLLDREKLNRVPVLKRLRKMESEAGKDVTVKDSTEVEIVDSAEEEREMDSRPRSDRGRRGRRGGRGGYTNTRPFRGGSGRGRRRGGRRGGMRDGPGRRQYDDDIPSVYVGGIPGSVRVSELKLKIREKEVNPLRVIWHGQNGHAFLQFQEPSAADEAIEALQNLEIVGKPLRVEMSRRSKPSGDADASGEAADVDDGPKHEADDNSRGNDNVEAQGKGDAGGDADHGLEVD